MATYNSPGVYISTAPGNIRPTALAPFKFAYIIGHSKIGPKNEPTQVQNLQDFVNQFGTGSLSLPSVRLYFANNPSGIVFFDNVAIAPTRTVKFAALSQGSYVVTVDTTPLTLTVPAAGFSPAEAATAFKALVDNSLVLSPVVSATIAAGTPTEVILKPVITTNSLLVAPPANALYLTQLTAAQVTAQIDNPVASTAYTLSVRGVEVTVTADVDPTDTELRDALVAAINGDPTLATQVSAAAVSTNQLTITQLSTDYPLNSTYVVSAVSVVDTTPTYPTITDFSYTLSAIDPEAMPGFVLAPEFFQSANSASLRESYAVALEGFASNPAHNWLALIDCGSTTQVNTFQKAILEANELTSPQGHAAYYYPYFVDIYDVVVPPSAAVASVAVRKYQIGGFAQPPAGVQAPVKGVKDITVRTTFQQQEVAALAKVNFLRVIPQNGICIFDDLTLSADPLFSSISTRVILNILVYTLRKQLLPYLFQSIDGTGQYFSALETTATHTLEQMRLAGLLYGATSSSAYRVVVNKTNVANLEAGIVDMQLYVVPAPRARQITISVIRTAIDQIPNLTFGINEPLLPADGESGIPTPEQGTPGQNG